MLDRIRAATEDDSRFLAWAMLAASRAHTQRGTFDLIAPDSEEDRMDLAEWMTLSEVSNFCQHSLFWVLECEGIRAATLAAYDPAAPGLMPLGAAVSDAFSGLGFDEAKLESAFVRLEAWDSCAPTRSPGTWVIEWVATKPEFRGRGFASQLIEHVMALGLQRGMDRAQLTTMIGNLPAQHCYEKLGFEIAGESRSAEFELALGAPGTAWMERRLHLCAAASNS